MINLHQHRFLIKRLDVPDNIRMMSTTICSYGRILCRHVHCVVGKYGQTSCNQTYHRGSVGASVAGAWSARQLSRVNSRWMTVDLFMPPVLITLGLLNMPFRLGEIYLHWKYVTSSGGHTFSFMEHNSRPASSILPALQRDKTIMV